METKRIASLSKGWKKRDVRVRRCRTKDRTWKEVRRVGSGGEVRKRHEGSAGATAEDGSTRVDERANKSFTRPNASAAVSACALALGYCSACRSSTSVALIPMAQAMQWNPQAVGQVQGAFLLGYAGTQALGGAAADQTGGKKVLAWGMAINALAALLLPFIVGQVAMTTALMMAWTLRATAGAGQGVAMPAMNQIVANNVSREKRASALGVVFAGFHAGNVLGLLVSPKLVALWGWKGLFAFYGMLGLPVLMAWNLLLQESTPLLDVKETVARVEEKITDVSQADPKQAVLGLRAAVADNVKTTVMQAGSFMSEDVFTATERDDESSNLLLQISNAFLPLLRPKACLGAMMAHAANHAAFFVVLSWTPTFFASAKGLSLQKATQLATIPWVAIAVFSPLWGRVADAAMSRGLSRLFARRGAQAIGSFASAAAFALLALMTETASPSLICLLFCIAMGCLAAGQAGFASSEIEIVAPQRAGAMVGACNTIASLAGMASTTLAGVCLARWPGNWKAVYLAVAAVLAVGGTAFTLWSEDRVVVE
uniref:Major facilitator superfamily (MFS) profile domain-containing protein n=1 Tax=Picocystis salinarum TaxID=88271 RepID=A0A7S3XFA2_9CHLO